MGGLESRIVEKKDGSREGETKVARLYWKGRGRDCLARRLNRIVTRLVFAKDFSTALWKSPSIRLQLI